MPPDRRLHLYTLLTIWLVLACVPVTVGLWPVYPKQTQGRIPPYTVLGLTWPSELTLLQVVSQEPQHDSPPEPQHDYPPIATSRAETHLKFTYEMALRELNQLESAPNCHKTAAQLLVNNCHLLEGKDEATFLTDSGHRIRDFVDGYSASLAICDLQRGSFTIPEDCNQFTESALSQIPVESSPKFHVSSSEISRCLSSLGASDSSWNTWISYRHKALRFCQAARADHEKGLEPFGVYQIQS